MIVEYKYLKTEKDIQEIYNRQNENVNVFKFNSINGCGKINDLKPSFFDFYYDSKNV